MKLTKQELTDDITTILAKHDPMDLAQYSETEYDIEAAPIAERILNYDVDQADLPFVIKNEFDRKFGETARHIPQETYFAIADDVYVAYVFATARQSARFHAKHGKG